MLPLLKTLQVKQVSFTETTDSYLLHSDQEFFLQVRVGREDLVVPETERTQADWWEQSERADKAKHLAWSASSYR